MNVRFSGRLPTRITSLPSAVHAAVLSRTAVFSSFPKRVLPKSPSAGGLYFESEKMNNSGSAHDDPPRGASRRQFIKTSSVLAAGCALAGSLNLARSAHAAGDDVIKIALVGCGGRGTGACQQALTTSGP
ncbi:MAG TPA: twin-arginine translocation signal domain-containing protein, partial [Pirellulales bacterium]